MDFIRVNVEDSGIKKETLKKRSEEAKATYGRLLAGEYDMTGWITWPRDITEKDVDDAERVAGAIKSSSRHLIVIGAGGSFLGAKAVIDMLQVKGDPEGVEVDFLGHDFSSRKINDTLLAIGKEDVSVLAISKSGNTAEIMSCYSVIREYMIDRYGKEEAAKRITIVTGAENGLLMGLAKEDGNEIYDVPDDIGGRYSVFTLVGLIPIAAAGIDIKALLEGAAKMEDIFEREQKSDTKSESDIFDYAAVRQIMADDMGKAMEVYEFYDPYLAFFGEWLKQLFAESEGKEGKGIFPASLVFSRDLHSVGQFLQQGREMFFETMVTTGPMDTAPNIKVPKSAGKPFAGKTFDEINESAVIGVRTAHVKAGVPVIDIRLGKLDPENVGAMLYWFMTECAVSAAMSGVDPFNQPGVEDYKREMREAL